MASEIRTFFRHCPKCGHRFEIRLVDKEQLSGSEAVSTFDPPLLETDKFSAFPSKRIGPAYVDLKDSAEPTIIDSMTLVDTYKCGRCGFMWTELAQHDAPVRVPRASADELLEQDAEGPKPPKIGED